MERYFRPPSSEDIAPFDIVFASKRIAVGSETPRV